MKFRKFKSSLLACVAMLGFTVLSAPADAAVTIERDQYGVPKITADTDPEMWFAFGFAQARDRLLQLEVLRQEAYGELPTYQDPAAHDPRRTRNWRRLHLFPDLENTLADQLANLEQGGGASTSQALNCFANGIQAFKHVAELGLEAKDACVTPSNLQEIIRNELGENFPSEKAFLHQIFEKQQLKSDAWKAVDSLALFHLRVMHEFSLRNTEMKNLQLLNDLFIARRNPQDAARIFNSVKWALTPNVKTTIPAGPALTDEIRHEASETNPRLQAEQKALDYHKKLVNGGIVSGENNLTINGCTLHSPEKFNRTVNESITLTSTDMDAASFPRNASNWWVISQSGASQKPGASPSTPNSLLYNGPQITALDPSHTYQVALQGPDFQFAGNAYIGSLNFWQGHNGTMAFGLTAGNIDVADVFCVPVKKIDGQWRYDDRQPFEPVLRGEEEEQLRTVASQPANQKFFGKRLDNMYTVGGTGWPVLAIDEADDQINGTAYIMRYNWQGLTASTLHNWLKATQATDLDQWNASLDGVAANFNLSAAHVNGAIGYRLTGALPQKAGMNLESEDPTQWNYFPDYDPRLPAPFTPEEGWQSNPHQLLRTYHKLKIYKNTRFIANWNQKPFVNMPDTDLDFDAYTPYDRVFIIERELNAQQAPWTLEDLLAMNGKLQRMDVNYFAYLPFLQELAQGPVNEDLQTILRWNGLRGNYQTGDNLGVHKGHILFYYWLEALNDQFKAKIALDDGSQLFKSLGTAQMKLKQPKLSTDSEVTSTRKLSTETSHNIPLGSRIMLQALHATFGAEFSSKAGFPAYQYDKFQAPLLNDRNEAVRAMQAALETAKANAERNWQISTFARDYLPVGSATFSGLSQTLAANDTNIGFRPGDPLQVKHFRNRGALNIGAALRENGVTARNISSPGIREYRGHELSPITPQWGDWTINQLNMFSANAYRPMHHLPVRAAEAKTAVPTAGNTSPHDPEERKE